MKRLLTISIAILLIQNFCTAQFKRQLDSLCVMCNHITSDSEKVIALGKVANLYYTYQLNHQGDSVLHEQLQLAELSDNNNLIFLALFGEAITNISVEATSESFDRTIAFLQKGIDFAKAQGQYDYIALGYIRIANVLRKRAQLDKALYNATQALQIMPNVTSDSIKAVIYIELGNAYVSKLEAVSAVRNFNNAFDIALKLKSVPLECDIYHCFAEMYYVYLQNPEVAKDFLKKSLKLDKETNYLEGVIRDYFDLARVTDEVSYLHRSIALCDSLHNTRYILDAKELLFMFYYVIDKNSNKALGYLTNEPDLREKYLNPGVGNYYLNIGHVYYYSNKFDSALSYYKLAEYDFIKNFDQSRSKTLFIYIGDTYRYLNDLANATAYYLKALNLSKLTNDGKAIAQISNSLSIIYEQQGNYQQAYFYFKQSKQYTDSLSALSKARDIVLLDVDRENKRHEDELQQEQRKQNNKRDLQYLLITIFISIVFVAMLVIGMFPVSKLTIKMLGYFFFISLFEFIIMIIDNSFLANVVHNEPLKLWLIKIVLIACLVPVQHYLEHNLIKFLESRKLLTARTSFSLKKLSLTRWWQEMKKPVPVGETGVEEDTAVL